MGWSSSSSGQLLDSVARLQSDVKIVPDITYITQSNVDVKLDLYVRAKCSRPPCTPVEPPHPTLIYFHGGGFFQESKNGRDLAMLPYLAMGMNVVNVDYRLAHVAKAPAAIEDCRCAIRWVLSHAKEYGIDTEKLVFAGDSVGGGVAALVAFAPVSAGLDNNCPGGAGSARTTPEIKAAAVISYYGASNLAGVSDSQMGFALKWFGYSPDRQQLAKHLSAITWVRPGLPPVFLMHGGKDFGVPAAQSEALHKALTAVGVPSELKILPNGGHYLDCCNREEFVDLYASVQSFLRKHGVLSTGDALAP